MPQAVAGTAGDDVQPVVHAFAGSQPALDHLRISDGPDTWLASLARLRPDLQLEPGGCLLSPRPDGAYAAHRPGGADAPHAAAPVATREVGSAGPGRSLAVAPPVAVVAGVLGHNLSLDALLAFKRGGTSGYRLILVGIAISFLLLSITDYLLARARIEEAQEATRWLLGSLNGRTWEDFTPLAISLAVLLPLVVPAGRALDDLTADLAQRHGDRLAAVLRVASFLVDGVTCHDRATPLPGGATIDVLPSTLARLNTRRGARRHQKRHRLCRPADPGSP